MKKIQKLLALMVALTMVFGLLCGHVAAAGFSDVASGAWYQSSVARAEELGLLGGFEDGTFRPDGQLQTAQAIKLAACLHQLTHQGSVTLENGKDAWYSTYVAYALENAILDKAPKALDKAITRGDFAQLMVKALPQDQLQAINIIPEDAIPDVKSSDPQAQYIYTLYRAGILQGDESYNFNTASTIKRSEVAAILVRLSDRMERIGAPAIELPEYDEVFVVIHTNDVHGYVDIEPYVKSVADGYKAVYGEKNVITLSSGDVFSAGHAFAGKYKGELIPGVMDAAGYDVLVPGNNDFDFGAEGIMKLSGMFTHTQVIAANMGGLDADGNPTGEAVFPASVVFETEKGTKVGLFGITCVGGAIDGIFQTTGSVETAAKMTEELKKTCGVVIGAGHTGWNDDLVSPSSNDATSAAVADACPGLSVYIDAHSHSIINDGNGWYSEASGALVTQAGSQGKYIGVATVYIKDGQAVASTAKLLSKEYVSAFFAPDAAVQALVDEGNTRLKAEVGKVIGHTDYYLNADRYDASSDGRSVRCDETNLGDLVCDAIRDFTGSDVAMFPGYQLRGSIQPGDMTGLDWNTVFGKGGTVYLFEKTGAELVEILKSSVSPVPKETPQFYQVSGVSFKYNKDGNTVELEDVMVGGEPIDLEKVYTVAYDGADPDFDREANKDKLLLDGTDALVEMMMNYLSSGKAVIYPDVPNCDNRIIKGTITGTVSMDPGAGGGQGPGGDNPPPKP